MSIKKELARIDKNINRLEKLWSDRPEMQEALYRAKTNLYSRFKFERDKLAMQIGRNQRRK